MAKPTFTLRTKDGGELPGIGYSPLMVIAGTQAHRLALHKHPVMKHWTVSDPKSGCKVCTVNGQYRGIRVSSAGLTLREVRQLALADVENLIARVGSDNFNAVLANPQPF
jgi:hypothetical protein